MAKSVRGGFFLRKNPLGIVLFGCIYSGFAAWAGGSQAAQPNDLKHLSLEDLGNVEVTTVSKEPEDIWQTPAAIYVLTQEDIRRSGATTLPDLLRTVPGVEVAELEGNQWAVGIRGFNSPLSKDVLLLIDGRSTYTPLFEGVYWDVQDVLLDDVDRIEIIRGPGGTIWGANAVNGVINIITRHGKDTQGALLSDSGGQVDRINTYARIGLHRGAKVQYSFFVKGLSREDEINPNFNPYDRWNLAHAGFHADWSVTSRDSLSVQGDIYKGQSGQQVSYGSYAPLAQLVVDDMFDVSGGNILANWEHHYDGGSDFHGQIYFDRTHRLGNEFGETRDTINLDFIDHLKMIPHRDVILGAGVRFSPSNVIQTQPTVDFEPHSQTDYIYSGFLQDAVHLPYRVTFTIGSKLEYNNYTGFEVQPNARVLWNPMTHATLWAGASRAVRTPGRLDRDLQLTDVYVISPPILVHIEGNPNFHSEDLLGYEAGYRQLFTPRLYVDVAAFKNHYTHLESFGARFNSTITTPVAATVLNIPYANGIDSATDGLEIAPDFKPTSWWELKGNFSHVHIAAQPRPGFNDTSTAASYEGSSPHRMATFQSLLNLPHGVEFDFDYRFVSRLPAQKAQSYQTMDAHASWKLCKSFRLNFAGRNLLQPEHEEFLGDNDNPVGIRRTVYGGLTWTH
jgi:iron complex outermembrane receptor protein